MKKGTGSCLFDLRRYHDENYLFGKGLIKAYLFESKYADYPRILVDADLIEEMHKIVEKRFDQSWKEYISIDGQRHYFNGLEKDVKQFTYSIETLLNLWG